VESAEVVAASSLEVNSIPGKVKSSRDGSRGSSLHRAGSPVADVCQGEGLDAVSQSFVEGSADIVSVRNAAAA